MQMVAEFSQYRCYITIVLMFHPFNTFIYKTGNDKEFLILTGMLFQTITPEYDKLPLKRLHFACGTNRFLLATDLKLDAVLLHHASKHFIQMGRS